MNNNRMKYASTPTYGMQKRNFAKKQTASEAVPTPDFTQQPAIDMNMPLGSFPAQNTFAMPQNVFPGGMQQAPGPYYTAQQPAMQPGVPVSAQPTFGINASAYGASQPMNGYPTFAAPQAQPGMPLYQPPYTGGPTPPYGMPAYPGYTAQGYPQNGIPSSPSVYRSEPVGDFSGMGGYGNPAGAQAMPGQTNPGGMNGGYPLAGFPGGGMMNGGNPAYSGNSPFAQQPMNGGYPRPPYGGSDGSLPAAPTPKQPMDTDQWLKILLFAVLPMLLIPCLFVSSAFDLLRYLFITLTVVTQSVLWYRQSFTSTMRTVITITYVVLCIVVIALLLGGNRKDATQTGAGLNAGQPTAEPLSSAEAAPLAAQATPSPVEDVGESEAELRLSTFMDYWQMNQIEDMVNLVQPSWSTVQDNAASALFKVISNRTPQEYTIEGISGTSADSSRTVTMSAFISKNNGKDAVRYRFMILMVRESGEWFVDPNSLATNDVATETPTLAPGKETILQSLAPRMTVTPIPDPSTKLYYNANGGKYYHADPNCSAVNPKFLPMASFLYEELDDAPYSSLQPCLKCGAPTQSLGSLASDATATPAP